MNVIAVGKERETVRIEINIANQIVHASIECTNNLNEILDKVDFLSLHVPKQSNGAAVLGAAEFAQMKKRSSYCECGPWWCNR